MASGMSESDASFSVAIYQTKARETAAIPWLEMASVVSGRKRSREKEPRRSCSSTQRIPRPGHSGAAATSRPQLWPFGGPGAAENSCLLPGYSVDSTSRPEPGRPALLQMAQSPSTGVAAGPARQPAGEQCLQASWIERWLSDWVIILSFPLQFYSILPTVS